MSENQKKRNGFFIPFECWYALSQLEDEHIVNVLGSLVDELTEQKSWDEIGASLSPEERCALMMIHIGLGR